MRFSLRFFCMTLLDYWLFLLGIASPAINTVVREADLSCIAVSHHPENILNPEKSGGRSASYLDDSQKACKRPRYVDYCGAVCGNDAGSPRSHSADAECFAPSKLGPTEVVAKFGHQGGRQTQVSNFNSMNNRPIALATGNENQDLSWSKNFCDFPTNLGGGNDLANNIELINPFTSDLLHEPHGAALRNANELEIFLNSLDHFAPEICHSTAESAGAESEDFRAYNVHWSPDQGQHQADLDDLVQEASRQTTQTELNPFLNKSGHPDTHGHSTRIIPATCGDADGQSSDSACHAHTKPMNTAQHTNDSRPNSFREWSFESLSRNLLDHITWKKSFTERRGMPHTDTAPPYADVQLQPLIGEKLKSPSSSSLGSSTVEKYVWPYTKTVNEILSSLPRNYVGASRWVFKDIPVVVMSQIDIPAPLIRVFGEGQVVLSPSQITSLLESLLKWILFNHEAFLNQITITPQRRPAFHQELLDWLKVELFSPKGSLPIVGQLKTNFLSYSRSDFGTVQIKVIDYLHALNASMSCKYSIGIIGIWYRNGYLKDWWELSDGGDTVFWKFMNQSIHTAHQAKLSLLHPSESSENSAENFIGNFRICDFQIQTIISPQRLGDSSISEILEDTHQTREKLHSRIDLIHNKYEAKSGALNKEFGGLPVALAELKAKNYQNYQLKVIKLLDPVNKKVPPHRIKSKLASFVKKMAIYHSILVEFLGDKKPNVIIGKQDDLFNWLEKKLFSFEEGLPVFGTVRKDMEIKKDKPFGDVQTYLIYYLSKGSERVDGDKSALAVLGYWCKNEFSELWNEFWESDDDYWEFMVKRLKMHHIWGLPP